MRWEERADSNKGLEGGRVVRETKHSVVVVAVRPKERTPPVVGRAGMEEEQELLRVESERQRDYETEQSC